MPKCVQLFSEGVFTVMVRESSDCVGNYGVFLRLSLKLYLTIMVHFDESNAIVVQEIAPRGTRSGAPHTTRWPQLS